MAPRYFIQYPDGSKDEAEFFKRSEAVKCLYQFDDVIEHCRSVLQLKKEEFMSEESEMEWIEENIESEAKELGYSIREVK